MRPHKHNIMIANTYNIEYNNIHITINNESEEFAQI